MAKERDVKDQIRALADSRDKEATMAGFDEPSDVQGEGGIKNCRA